MLKQAWPSTIRTVKGDHNRFEETYFSAFPGYYFTVTKTNGSTAMPFCKDGIHEDTACIFIR